MRVFLFSSILDKDMVNNWHMKYITQQFRLEIYEMDLALPMKSNFETICKWKVYCTHMII